MAFEQQIDQYKSLKTGARFAIMAVIGLSIPGYIYYTQSEVVANEITTAESALTVAKTKLAEAKRKQNELPAKLIELKKAKFELSKDKRRLSRDFEVDEVLREVSIAARDLDVSIDSFKPDPVVEFGDKVKLKKQRVQMKIKGKFIPTARFMDNVLNLEPLVFIESYKISKGMSSKKSVFSNSTNPIDEMKERIIVQTDLAMTVYRKIISE